MKVVFLPLITRGWALGSMSRCLALAASLEQKGHQPCFVSGAVGRDKLDALGYPMIEAPPPPLHGPHHAMHDLADVAVFMRLTDEAYIRQSLDCEAEAIERFRPDVLVSEFKLTAPISAESAGLPLVSTACTPAKPDFVSPLYRGEPRLDHTIDRAGFNRVLAERGQEPLKSIAELFFSRSRVKLAPTTPELEPDLEGIPGMHYVGYLLDRAMELGPLPPELENLSPDKRLVFVYLSMSSIGPDIYTEVLPRAFDGAGYHVAVAVGNHPGLPELPEATETVSYYRFIPGMSALNRSSAYISHGGQNSVVSALIAGVPSLLFPGGDFERDFNASGAVKVGAAVKLDDEDFNPSGLIGHLDELVSGNYAANAAAAGQRVHSLGGPDRAAELIIEAVGNTPPE